MPDTVDRDSRDALTGLGDVQQLRRTIANWCADWPGDSGPCPIHAMLITLGRMETVNVAFGENAGDGALVEVARGVAVQPVQRLECGLADPGKPVFKPVHGVDITGKKPEQGGEVWRAPVTCHVGFGSTDAATGHQIPPGAVIVDYQLGLGIAVIAITEYEVLGSCLPDHQHAMTKLRQLLANQALCDTAD